jgi:hypothetical protein
VAACSDGTCTVLVRPGAEITLPARAVRSMTVQSVVDDDVALAGTFYGGKIAGSGRVHATGPSSSGPGSVTFTLQLGETATVDDDLVVEVLGVGDNAAVLEIR